MYRNSIKVLPYDIFRGNASFGEANNYSMNRLHGSRFTVSSLIIIRAENNSLRGDFLSHSTYLI